MNRIKNLDEVKVQGGELWCELVIKENKSIIIDPNKPLDLDYMIIKNKGIHVTDVEIGDIVLDCLKKDFDVIKLNGKSYTKVMRNLCHIIVDSDNFKI